MLLRREDPGRPRLVVILEEASQARLVVEAGREMVADGGGVGAAQSIIEPLVVAIVEALLQQLPFEVPIGFGQEGEVAASFAHSPYRLWPKRRRRPAPSTLEDLRQKEHRHVAPYAI